MKKLISIVLCAVMLINMVSVVLADAMNMAGGCKTDVTVKKADPSAVRKDGIIGEGEYEELVINRDPGTTDLLFSWFDSVSGNALLSECEEFLKNVHFYFSWDEVNGLNIAAKATLLETPVNTSAIPEPGTGDTFLFQFGMMASVVQKNKTGNDILYRGISINTETGDLLIGDYGAHGYNDAANNFVAGENYMVTMNGNEITYEISYPIEAVVETADRSGNIPEAGAMIMMNISLTGGSAGNHTDGAKCYAISLGDGGYMTSKWAGTELSPAKVYFSHDEIASASSIPEMSFPDVDKKAWSYDSIKELYDVGIMGGFDDGKYYPHDNVTRGELAYILYNAALRAGLSVDVPSGLKFPYTDVSPQDYYYDAVALAYSLGLLNVTADGKINPNANVTRAEIAYIIYNLAKFGGYDTSANSITSTFTDIKDLDEVKQDAIAYVYSMGILTGVSTSSFAPNNTLTREQISAVLYRCIDLFGLEFEKTAAKPAPIHKHNFVSEVFMPNETTGGYTLHTCTSCGYSYKDSFKDALGLVFPDVSKDFWYYNDVKDLYYLGIMGGFDDGNYHPDMDVTRGDLAYTFYNAALRAGLIIDVPEDFVAPYSDVKPGDSYYDAIALAYSLGILNPTKDGMIHPERSITRAELAYVLYMIADFWGYNTSAKPANKVFSDLDGVDALKQKAISYVYSIGLMNGTSNTTFYPDGNVTRAQIAAILTKAIDTFGIEFEITDVKPEPLHLHIFASQTIAPTHTSKGYTLHTCTACGYSYKSSFVDAIMSFSDVEKSEWYYNYVNTMYSAGIMVGFDDGNYHPQMAVTRGDLAYTLYNTAIRLGVNVNVPEGFTSPYSDVTPKDDYYEAIAIAYAMGLLDVTDDGKIHPEREITKAEIACIIYNAVNLFNIDFPVKNNKPSGFTDIKNLDSFKRAAIEYAYSRGILTGDQVNRFNPDSSVTRAELAVFAYRLYSFFKVEETAEIPAPMHLHVYTLKTVVPTCTEKGYTEHICTKCGFEYTDKVVNALGHNITKVSAKAPTCTEVGWKAYDSCSRCSYSTYVEIPAKGHSYTSAVTKPTCTADGYTTHTCSACGDSYVDSIVAAKGHSYGDWIEISAPTCTEKGRAYRICDDCGKRGNKIIAALGHAKTKHDAKSPTCTEIGWNAYEECSRCDYTTYNEIPSLGHDYDNWTVTATPDCTNDGSRFRTCETCKYVENEILKSPGHNIDPYWVFDIEATEESEGEKSHHCLACGERFDITVVPKKVDSTKIFEDVPTEDWAKESIDFVVSNNLMKGTSDDSFSPNQAMTRAMVVTVLWRVAGEPKPNVSVPFTDLKEDWYADAVAWAYENKIVLGTTETTFSPYTEITREQLATILYRYSNFMNYDTTASEDIGSFKDSANASGWAEEALEWAIGEGLISGSNEGGIIMLNPLSDATRVQFATILSRFCKKH